MMSKQTLMFPNNIVYYMEFTIKRMLDVADNRDIPR
jgi:hypothetical protein